jgi:hypothetical protein
MRTSLFLSALFAVSLVGGIASAEKPDVKEQRKRTDIVDRSYARSDMTKRAAERREVDRSTLPRQVKSPAEARWNCPETSDDCRVRRASADRVAVKRADEKNAADTFKQRKDHKADSRWNCPVDNADCAGVKSTHGGDRATVKKNSGQKTEARAQMARDSARATVAADRAKSDKSASAPKTFKEQREAERMKGMLKHAVCKKTGADC